MAVLESELMRAAVKWCGALLLCGILWGCAHKTTYSPNPALKHPSGEMLDQMQLRKEQMQRRGAQSTAP